MNIRSNSWLSALAALAATALFSSAAAAAPPTASADLQPRRIEVGQSAYLTVEVSGLANPRVNVGSVAGLDIRPGGTSQQVVVSNGTLMQSVSSRYRVSALQPGRYVLQPSVEGTPLGSFTLEVVPSAGGSAVAPQGRGSAGASAQPQASRGGRTLAGPPGRRAFLRVRMPKRELVVGETVPVTVRAFVKAGTAGVITAPPELSSDAFAFRLDGDARQGQTEINGTPYATLTWRGHVTALLPGEHEVEASAPAKLRWRELVEQERRMPRSSLFDDLMNDPFFASAFGGQSPFAGFGLGGGFGSTFRTIGYGPTRSRETVLRRDLGTIVVREPPLEGRPADYTGAIGAFEVAAEIEPAQGRVGEPLTVRLVVRGEGNFDRLDHGMFPEGTEGVRVYPPTSRFEASGRDPRQGEKVFEQTLVPTRAGSLQLPELTFSTYDPERGEYVTLRATVPAVDVLPSADGATVADSLRDAAEARAQALDAPPAAVGEFRAALAPARLPWLPLAGLWMLVAVALGLVLSRRDPERAAERWQRWRHAFGGRRSRWSLRAAARKGDDRAFLDAAERAARAHLAAVKGIPAEAVTAADAGELVTLRRVLEAAEGMRFGDASLPADLTQWLPRIEAELRTPTEPQAQENR